MLKMTMKHDETTARIEDPQGRVIGRVVLQSLPGPGRTRIGLDFHKDYILVREDKDDPRPPLVDSVKRGRIHCGDRVMIPGGDVGTVVRCELYDFNNPEMPVEDRAPDCYVKVDDNPGSVLRYFETSLELVEPRHDIKLTTALREELESARKRKGKS